MHESEITGRKNINTVLSKLKNIFNIAKMEYYKNKNILP